VVYHHKLIYIWCVIVQKSCRFDTSSGLTS